MDNVIKFEPLKKSVSVSYIKDYSDYFSTNKAINRSVLLNKVKTIQSCSYVAKGSDNIRKISNYLNIGIKDLLLVPIYDSIIYRNSTSTGTSDIFEIHYPVCDTDDYLLYGNSFEELIPIKITRINNHFIKTDTPINDSYKIIVPAKFMSLTNSFNINKISNHYYVFNCQFTQLK